MENNSQNNALVYFQSDFNENNAQGLHQLNVKFETLICLV